LTNAIQGCCILKANQKIVAELDSKINGRFCPRPIIGKMDQRCEGMFDTSRGFMAASASGCFRRSLW
jgi:hypothetical protein